MRIRAMDIPAMYPPGHIVMIFVPPIVGGGPGTGAEAGMIHSARAGGGPAEISIGMIGGMTVTGTTIGAVCADMIGTGGPAGGSAGIRAAPGTAMATAIGGVADTGMTACMETCRSS